MAVQATMSFTAMPVTTLFMVGMATTYLMAVWAMIF
jgi:hypothetical protein